MENEQMEEKKYFSNDRKEMLQFVPIGCKKILEIGCSEGKFGQLLKGTSNAEIWGVEMNESAAIAAKKNIDTVVYGDFFDIEGKLPSRYFDCIVCNDVIEHIFDPWLFLRKVTRLLSDEGYVVCSIPNVRYVGNLVELLIKKDWEYKRSGILDITHCRFYTKKSMIRLFESSGFSVLNIKGINGTKSVKVKFASLFSLGFFSDITYLEFAIVARLPKVG
jgi:2-polyprenyl-3-methyl-5-hydroxy-6-metoxy-1,4-benzoquinol methylase